MKFLYLTIIFIISTFSLYALISFCIALISNQKVSTVMFDGIWIVLGNGLTIILSCFIVYEEAERIGYETH